MKRDEPTIDPMALMGALVLDSGRRWGEVATDWQLADARALLTPEPGGERLHWWGRPRGGSKSTDLAGIAATWLVAQAQPLDEGFVLAADRDQAARLLRFARGMIERTSGLGEVLEVQTHAIVHRRTGARVVALAADAPGAEGLLSPLILVDELPQWADTRQARALWEAAFSAVPKVRGLRFVVIGHAGVSGSWQHTLFEAFTKSPLWRVHDVPGPLPWIDPAVLEDQRAVLTDSQYRRRHLNEWSSADEALVTVEDLRKCVVLDGPLRAEPGVRYQLALDVGLSNDRTVAVVCHAERRSDLMAERRTVTRKAGERDRIRAFLEGRPDPKPVVVTEAEPVRIVLDRMMVWQGTKAEKVALVDVEAWILEAHRNFNGAPLICDPYQAVGMAQRLRGAGVEVDEFAFGSASVGRLASTLHRLLRDGALALPDDEALLDELANVRLIEKSSGVVRMDHAAGRHDDRAIALALACLALLDRPIAPAMSVTAYKNTALVGTR